MNPLSTRDTLVAGQGEADTPLTAFDAALLEARVGNYNLVRVSSVMTSGVVFADSIELPIGNIVFIACGSYPSTVRGERICAAICAGRTKAGHGMIMEYAGPGQGRG